MFEKNIFRSKVLVFGVLTAFVLMVTPGAGLAQAPAAPQGGSLVGFVYDKDMAKPVAEAVVKIREVAQGKEFSSSLSDENGMYAITGVPEGRYILGINTPSGDYNFDYILHLKAGETA
ncbi:MAG: hypothetical protein FJY80_10875, partial [Candidatus Aminicenantes bacterium]|nr:hypothetical protein [Candidatus Aminicenantes bacterium]